jgi:hypothetical protein
VFYTTDQKTRDEFIAGLTELLAFLMTNPFVPVPAYGAQISLYADSYETGGKDQVDHLAWLITAPITDETAFGGHYQATRDFGPIEYTAVSIPEAATARYMAPFTHKTFGSSDTNWE